MVEKRLGSRIELFISAENLSNKRTFSVSNPYCIVYTQKASTEDYFEIGRTEVVKSNLSPRWKQTILIDFAFESRQPIKFFVFDQDNNSSETLGEVSANLSDILARGTMKLDLSLKGTLKIIAMKFHDSSDAFEISFKGIKLAKKDLFGKSDPYLVLYSLLDIDHWVEVYRTEVIMNTLDPIWTSLSITSQRLCDDDRFKPIKIECYDWDSHGGDDLIGTAEVNLAQITTEGFQFELLSKHRKKPSGVIEVSKVIFGRLATSLMDYINTGLQIDLSVGIDFTDSESQGGSANYHFIEPNPYRHAIEAIGSILEAFDTDKKIPVFGFGGSFNKGEVSHCFPLNFNEKDPYVDGIQGVVQIYQETLVKVKLSWPIHVHYIIEKIIKICKKVTPVHSKYFILLILTNGEIDDFEDAMKSIVKASEFPISFIFAGIGTSSFRKLRELDRGDILLVDVNGKKARRNNTQFVQFNSIRGDQLGESVEILRKIPLQIIEFMRIAKHHPVVPL